MTAQSNKKMRLLFIFQTTMFFTKYNPQLLKFQKSFVDFIKFCVKFFSQEIIAKGDCLCCYAGNSRFQYLTRFYCIFTFSSRLNILL